MCVRLCMSVRHTMGPGLKEVKWEGPKKKYRKTNRPRDGPLAAWWLEAGGGGGG